MTNVKEILAKNLKENRRRLGITQPELAERAGMSTQYLAMIEIARKFPTADILNQLAAALEINPHELFSVSVSPERVIEQLQQAILGAIDKRLDNLDQTIENALEKVIEKRCADVHLPGGNFSQKQ
ncbi:MAG: helix-turn-helix domain-containing protein [Treponema sp.]|jgi:transcriptional regulator with XRE-family HTH domain|nr:helix-turn-helix domain-containing protein [Treponema sp.]